MLLCLCKECSHCKDLTWLLPLNSIITRPDKTIFLDEYCGTHNIQFLVSEQAETDLQKSWLGEWLPSNKRNYKGMLPHCWRNHSKEI